MKQSKLNTFAKKVKKVFSPKRLNLPGRTIGFLKRARKVTAHRLVTTLVSLFATRQVKTLADIQRGFNALFDETVAYKPFHNQLAKDTFPDLMREAAEQALTHFVTNALGFETTHAFARFKHLFLQDGSSFGIKKTLKKVFPGRFKKTAPAAVELHVTLDLLTESIEAATLTPDTDSERAALPEPSLLRGSLILADAGYPSEAYLKAVDEAMGAFLMRYQAGINPLVIQAFDEHGMPLGHFKSRRLKKLRLSKKRVLDCDIECAKGGRFRIIVSWNKKQKKYRFLITNLPRVDFSTAAILTTYRLRWQIELLFKELKSSSNLHAFDTEKPGIVEGLIWAAVAASALKRYLAHAAQQLCHIAISTQKVAKCLDWVLSTFIRELINGTTKKIQNAFDKMMLYLARNAARSHPKRDRRSGRLQSGLQPILEPLKN